MSAEQTLLAGIGSVLSAVGSIARVENGPRRFLAKLGWDLPPGVNDIGLAALNMDRVGVRLVKWATVTSDAGASTEDKALALADLADTVIKTLAGLRDLQFQAPQDYLTRTRIKDEFLTRLFDLYLIQSAAVASPPVFDTASLLGWFELRRFPDDPSQFQVAHLRHIVHWDRVPMLLTDPTKLLRETYGWGTATFDPDTLVVRLGAVLQHLAAEVKHRELPAIPLARLHGGEPPAHKPQIQLFLPLIGSSNTLTAEAGISVFGLPPTTAGGVDGGIGFAPYAEGAATVRLDVSSTLSIGMSAQADLGSGLALILRPNHDPVLRTDLNKPVAGTAGAGAELKLDLTRAVPQGSAAMTLLAAAGARLEATSIAAVLGVLVGSKGTDCTLHLQVKGGKFTLKPEGLPFIEKASREGLVVEGDVDLAFSHRHGVSLDGRAELKISKAIGRQIGPVTINFLEIGLAANGGGLASTVTVSVSVKLGPVRLLVDQVGVRMAIAPGSGSLGSADLTIRPKPPGGIGVEVDASVVTGGGFLRFDSQKGEYSGVLELQIAEKISVKGIGLLTTKLPGGGKGFSLVVVIFVENFTPIQLGFGFTLTAIGGLLAINRTFSEDVLRSGLKNHTLETLMFPKDPIRNAPQIISNLNKVFPPANGHHLFGPMVQIGWGTPLLITANVALILEFGARRRLLMLGQVVAVLPKRENDLVRLQMDAIGVIDFDQGTAALDATLHDSRLLHKFVLTGDMAMRMQWKSGQNFALAVGGFHHAFNPPPNFPRLQRISINLSSGNNPRFRCEAYFALTSNTVQFGARAELYAEAHGFNIQGGVGFDVLIQFDPFSFIAEFDAHLQLRRGSTNLFSVRVKGALSGPRPLHLKAKATFSIFWWDISIPVNVTLVKGEKPPLPEPVEVLPRLKEALSDRGNWISQLPDRQKEVVTLRPNPWAANDVLLHPLGTLTIKQNVVPLNFHISRFGQGPPAGAHHFKISVNPGGFEQAPNPVKDFFAPAQFIEMSDDEKLSRPSFELMDAGLTIGSNKIDFTTNSNDWLEVETIKFETKTIDPETKVPVSADPLDEAGEKIFYQLSHELLLKQARFGAAGSSETRRAGEAKYRTTLRKYNMAKEGWTMIAVEGMAVQSVPGVDANKPSTYSEVDQELRKLKQRDPAKAAGLKILRPSDLSSG